MPTFKNLTLCYPKIQQPVGYYEKQFNCKFKENVQYQPVYNFGNQFFSGFLRTKPIFFIPLIKNILSPS